MGGGAVKVPTRLLFTLPIRNRYRSERKRFGDFMNMIWLQDDKNRTRIAPTREPIWRLKTGSSKYYLWTASNMYIFSSTLVGNKLPTAIPILSAMDIPMMLYWW